MSSVPYLSVIIPVFNEEDNLSPLTEELVGVLKAINRPYEIIFIDDGSNDASPERLNLIRQTYQGIRIITLKRNSGQTSAFDAGFKAACGDIIITMDADLQNDPGDIPLMISCIGEYDLVCGWRHKRNDTAVRKMSSLIANAVRNSLSGEEIKDVGCSLKAFRRDYAKKLKLYTGMHRFFPTLVKMEGGRVTEVKVNHRSRKHGTAKYNIRNRVLRSFLDLLAVCWMKRRYLTYEIKEQRQ
ncbi:MAG: glycosyltransferase family 2 protein [Pseudomonadota bacterium]